MWRWLVNLFKKPSILPELGDLAEQINHYRVIKGLPILIIDSTINSIASDWAIRMNQANKMMHGNFYERLTLLFRGRVQSGAENVAWGQTSSSQCVADWATSTGHNRNMLGDWTHVGGGQSGKYWCAIFSKLI